MEVVPALWRRTPADRSSGSGTGFLNDPTRGTSGLCATTIVLSVHGEQHRTRRQDDGDRYSTDATPRRSAKASR